MSPSLLAALAAAATMTDRELAYAVRCSYTYTWRVAAVALGRSAPPDLEGRRSRFSTGSDRPQHPIDARRSRRLDRLVAAAREAV